MKERSASTMLGGLTSFLILLLGIDGLRQDVLYAQNDVGVPGDGVYTDPMGLAGVGQVLGMRSVTDVRYPADPGQYVWTAPVLTGEMEKKHAKLGGVTAVFPSITLASWASIFTGELPGKTGELGNEFFDSIAGFVDKLKELGQFYNKVFLITSDHGHTEMPAGAPYKDTNWLGMTVEKQGDTSCAYKSPLDDKTIRAEKENNNLHVWELGALLTEFAPPEKTGLLLLAPAALDGSGIKFTTDVNQATVVAALNGPMAHIYVKGANWQDDPDPERMGRLLIRLKRFLQIGDPNATGEGGQTAAQLLPRLMGSIETILVRTRREGAYEVYEDVARDASGQLKIVPGSMSSVSGVKAAERIEGMNHKDRSGDIVLLFKSDVEDTTKMNRYTSGVSCKSWHGSLNRTDSYVPFIVSYPGGNASELDKPIEDVCPGKQCAGNWKATDLIKKIIELQYSGK